MATRPSPSGPSRTRILVVEDDEDTATIYHDALTHYGHDVQVAEDGNHAVRSFAAVTPDVLIVDIGLPGTIDGWGVIEHVKALESPPPCIVITALEGEELRERAEQLECRAFMTKPVEPLHLVHLVEEVTGEAPSESPERAERR